MTCCADWTDEEILLAAQLASEEDDVQAATQLRGLGATTVPIDGGSTDWSKVLASCLALAKTGMAFGAPFAAMSSGISLIAGGAAGCLTGGLLGFFGDGDDDQLAMLQAIAAEEERQQRVQAQAQQEQGLPEWLLPAAIGGGVLLLGLLVTKR